jgi:hypothetical protein
MALGAYWLLLARPPGLSIPRQIVLGLTLGGAFFFYGCAVARRRGRLTSDGRIDHGFVTKLIYQSTSLAATIVGIAVPSVYLVVAYAIEGTAVGAPEIEARLPGGYSLNFVLAIAAIGGLTSTAYTTFGYLDHVNAG